MIRAERVVTSGIFSLDGQDFEVDNNVWLVGDDDEVVVVDAAHDAGPILDAIEDRRVRLIACTHAHNDHINAARDVQAATRAPIAVHPADRMLWDAVYPDAAPDADLSDGQEIPIAGSTLTVLHTPGHSPGSVSLRGGRLLFSGDTLFAGGPGATGRSYSDFDTIIASIQDRLLTLPPRHDRAHRPRRRHVDRQRGAAPGRLDRPRPLTSARPPPGLPSFHDRDRIRTAFRGYFRSRSWKGGTEFGEGVWRAGVSRCGMPCPLHGCCARLVGVHHPVIIST